MKKGILLILLVLLPLISAINFEVKEISSSPTVIREFGNPAIITLEITNKGLDTEFSFISPTGTTMEPSEKIKIAKNEKKEINLKIYPRSDFDYNGNLIFDYIILGQDFSRIEQQTILRVVKLQNAIEIIPNSINPGKNSIEISIKNKENYNFKKVNAKLSSVFFNINEEFDLAPLEKKTFNVNLKKDEINRLLAGIYTVKGDFEIDGKKFSIEREIRFEENDKIIESESSKGFIVSTKTISKSNEGNLAREVETSITKNIISRLFTSFSPEPSSVKRDGLLVTYVWRENLTPGNKLNVIVRTNWLLPLLFLITVILVGYIARGYINNGVILRKKISFVRANGGEFALKVTINVKATKNVNRVMIVDRLPGLVTLHEKFGVEQPSRVDEKRKRIEWNFPALEQGDRRVISYIIYSKIGVLGKFALPSTTAIFERDGKVHEAHSNRAFFVAEQKSSTD